MTKPEHYHCPCDCEHPQPFKHPDGGMFCGKCWFLYYAACEMVLCTPETCPSEEESDE